MGGSARQSSSTGQGLVDEILESFVTGAGTPGSLEDPGSVGGLPRATWGGGQLEATVGFDGTGGPGGDFDLVLSAGQTLFISTTFAQVLGGPNGTPAIVQDVVGGVLDLDDLRLEFGSQLIFVGPNPATILVAGEADIAGRISVQGGDNPGVGQLNSANNPEPGAPGNAGGGTGGTGSFLTTQSTPSGLAGFGAFNLPDAGGAGGETGFGLFEEADRRGAGGGGGRLGSDVFYDHDDNPATPDVHAQTLVGMDAESGFGGTATGLGALSQAQRPVGGELGPSPFVDALADNDFLGAGVLADGTLRIGELAEVQPGAGGGGGGDAVQSDTFPLTPFQSTGDEKGSGGGGAGGGLKILAIGPITLRESGSLVADGGHGGGGENTFDSARVGGAGGGGSGGHLVIASATYVEVEGQAQDAGDNYRDDPSALDHFPRPLSALGGQGGEGRRAQFSGAGGASAVGPTRWGRDGIPVERMDLPAGAGPPVPPLDLLYENFFAQDFADPEGPALGAGGDGGPGILQLHAPDPALNLRFSHPAIIGAYGVPGGADVTRATVPPPSGWRGQDEQADTLLPLFGSQSAAMSRWIYLGLDDQAPGGALRDVRFVFRGIDPATGEILLNGDQVPALPPVLGPVALGTGVGEARILPGDLSLVFDPSGLAPALLASPDLMLGYDVTLESLANPGSTANFEVLAAAVDAGATRAIFTVVGTGGTLQDFVDQAGPDVQASVVPRWFRVFTGGEADVLPSGASVSFAFDATRSDSGNRPDPALSFSAGNGGSLTSDISLLSEQPWAWVRFEVNFDLGPNASLVSPSLPALELLKIPFLAD